MKYLIIFSLILLNACNSADQNVEKEMVIKERAKHEVLAELLKKFNSTGSSDDSKKIITAYFEAFPGSFEDFQALYGYKDSPSPLYEKYPEHLMLFKMYKDINKETYLNKLISVSKNGNWEADATNNLQDLLIEGLQEYPSLMIEKLNQLKSAETQSVLTFLFDGPHPSFENTINKELESKISDIDNEFLINMKVVCEKLKKRNNHD